MANLNEITRRRLLRNLGKLCVCSGLGGINVGMIAFGSKAQPHNTPPKAATAAKPQSSSCSGSGFNVVLHGLFILEVWTDDATPKEKKVRLMTPDCSDLHVPHKYRAGSWGQGQFRDFHKGPYTPGWDAKNKLCPDLANLPRTEHLAGQLNYGNCYFSLYLPYPKSILPRRVIDQKLITSSGLIKNDFPLVTVLTYDVPPSSPIMDLGDNSWNPQANFHIFAEPECEITDETEIRQHGKDTLDKINSVLPAGYSINLGTINGNSIMVNRDSCDRSKPIVPDEEQSLFELQPCSTPKNNAGHKLSAPTRENALVHLATCASLTITGP